MRRVRYAVAMSLDGFIAGPKGEADWIEMDPTVGRGRRDRHLRLLANAAAGPAKRRHGTWRGRTRAAARVARRRRQGHGQPVISDNSTRVKLHLLSSEHSPGGVLSLKYSVAPKKRGAKKPVPAPPSV